MCFGSQDVTQTTKVELSPEQRELVQSGLGLTKQVTEGPLPAYPQPQGFSPEQLYAQGGIVGKSLPGGAVSQTADSVGGASNFLLNDAIDVNSNPGLQGAIQAAINPIRDEFQRVIMPGIAHEQIGTGAFGSYGSSRGKLAEDLANRAYLRQVGDTTSNLVSDAYTSGLEAMTKGLALAPQTLRSQLFPETAIEAVGQQRRQLGQQQTQAQFEESMFPFNLGLQLIGASGATPGGGSTATATGAQPGNPLTQMLGTAISIIPFL